MISGGVWQGGERFVHPFCGGSSTIHIKDSEKLAKFWMIGFCHDGKSLCFADGVGDTDITVSVDA